MTIDEALAQATISVPDAGKLFFGLERNGAYEAARRGDFATIRIGRRMMVLVVPLAEKLGLKARLASVA